MSYFRSRPLEDALTFKNIESLWSAVLDVPGSNDLAGNVDSAGPCEIDKCDFRRQEGEVQSAAGRDLESAPQALPPGGSVLGTPPR